MCLIKGVHLLVKRIVISKYVYNSCVDLLKYVATWLVVFILFVARFIKINEFVPKHTCTVRRVVYFLINKKLEPKLEQSHIN